MTTISPGEWLAIDDSQQIEEHLIGGIYWTKREPLSARRVKRKRRPSLGRTIRAARKAGVDRVTLPDGRVLHFGESNDPTTAPNPWLASLDEVTKQ